MSIHPQTVIVSIIFMKIPNRIIITWIFAYFAVFSLKHFWIDLIPVYVFFVPLFCIFDRRFIILIQRWELDFIF